MFYLVSVGIRISLRPPLMVTSYLQFLSPPVAVGESLLVFVEKSEWEQPADQSTSFKPAFDIAALVGTFMVNGDDIAAHVCNDFRN